MTAKIRKQIYIEPYQDALHKRISERTGLSEAEIIRQAIDRCVESLQAPGFELSARTEEVAFIESLLQLGPVDGGRVWRREELFDRSSVR